MPFGGECGAPYQAGARFCGGCGNRLVEAGPARPSSRGKRAVPWQAIGIGAGALLAILIVVLVLSRVGPGTSQTSDSLHAIIRDSSITIDHSAVRVGRPVTLRNVGSEYHEIWFLRTDLPLDRLPQHGNREFVEGPNLVVIDIHDVRPEAESVAFASTREPGRYVLACGLPGHYARGVRAAFEVRG